MDQAYIILLGILALSIIGHNMSVAYAVGIVLVIKLLGIPSVMHFMDKQGLNWGIIILTAAILIPIANGSITYKEIIGCFSSRLGIISLFVGVFVALAGGAGVVALKSTPEMVASLIIGTMLGVFIFKGVAVGPLIAAGMTYWVLSLMKYFNI